MKISLALLALLVFAATASADTILTYAGNATSDPLVLTPNPCGCALDGMVNIAAIIPSVEATDSAPGMYEQGNRGIWTAVTTPEPGTLELLGAGLLALLARKRWQLRHRQVPKGTWEPLA